MEYQNAKDLPNWDLICKRLTTFSKCWAPHISPEDVVAETVCKFLESSNRLGWNPRRAPLEVFLFGVCRNVARDHRRIAARDASFSDPAPVDENQKLLWIDPRKRYESEIVFSQVARALQDDMDKNLYALWVQIKYVDHNHNINQQLAESLGIEPRDVVNIKKRLQRRLKLMERPSAPERPSESLKGPTSAPRRKDLISRPTLAAIGF